MAEAAGEFRVESWEEQPWDEREGAGKLTHARIAQAFSGDLAATATIQMLMAFAPDGQSARYVGVQRMDGTLGGREGTFVLESSGTYADGVARIDFTVVEGSGTGDLAGLTGSGSAEAPMGSTGTYRLTYDV
jgi:hypothetical protein